MKFLCLHGRGTNSRILQLQTAALREALGPQHEFDFVEGGISCPPDPNIQAILSPSDECYTYFEYNTSSLQRALEDVRIYVTDNGPFDAILGFSEGASFGASLIIEATLNPSGNAQQIFKCGVFICAGPALNYRGEGRKYEYSRDGEVIHIPTAHIFGSKDVNAGNGIGLSMLCDAETREVFDHGGGHEVPRGAAVTEEMAQCVSKVVNRVNFS